MSCPCASNQASANCAGVQPRACASSVTASTSARFCSTLPSWKRGFCRRQSLAASVRSEEHTSELQSLMRISYAVFCLKKKKKKQNEQTRTCASKRIVED